MNPHDLSASDLLIWGIFLHLVADWPLQNDWMAKHKVRPFHPAGYVHATIHGILLALVFGWVAIFLAVAHLLIDFRKPVQWWSRLMRQSPPKNQIYFRKLLSWQPAEEIPLYDIGLEVRIWTDQVFHFICIAVLALLIT